MSKPAIIVAPHGDDEIVGCFSVLLNRDVRYVMFGTDQQHKDAFKSRREHGFSTGIAGPSTNSIFYTIGIAPHDDDDPSKYEWFFPDPVTEWHPSHVAYGNVGVEMFRAGYDVTFYSVQMQAKYISEVADPNRKKEALNYCYPEKSDLWKYDHKYFLFEGYTKWILPI